MSPLRTEALHQVGDREHLFPVGFIGFQGGDLGCECPSVFHTGGRFDESPTDRL